MKYRYMYLMTWHRIAAAACGSGRWSTGKMNGAGGANGMSQHWFSTWFHGVEAGSSVKTPPIAGLPRLWYRAGVQLRLHSPWDVAGRNSAEQAVFFYDVLS
jgi:hypothetical protein